MLNTAITYKVGAKKQDGRFFTYVAYCMLHVRASFLRRCGVPGRRHSRPSLERTSSSGGKILLNSMET